jgi:hypothetical protein
VIDHTSSLPACDAYDFDTAVFGNVTLGDDSGPLWVEVFSGSCPSCLEDFQVVSLPDGDTVTFTNLEGFIAPLSWEFSNSISMDYGVVFEIDYFEDCLVEISSDGDHFIGSTVFVSEATTDTFSCSGYRTDSWSPPSGTKT